MANTRAALESRFRSNVDALVSFVADAIRELEKHGKNFISIAKLNFTAGLINEFKDDFLIEGFIEKSYENSWEIIRTKNEEAFISKAAKIFSFLPSKETDIFIDLFTATTSSGERIIKQEMKDSIWQVLHGMIRISMKYVNIRRKDNPKYFKYIDLETESKKWNLVL